MDPDSEYVSGAPPPAYSEQEFDQKVSLATEISVLIPLLDEDGWDKYDPNALEDTEDSHQVDFVENSSNIINHSGPSYPSISPLQFEKKSHPKPHPNVLYSSYNAHYAANNFRMRVSSENSNMTSDSSLSWRGTQVQEKDISLHPHPYANGSKDALYVNASTTSQEIRPTHEYYVASVGRLPDPIPQEWRLRNQQAISPARSHLSHTSPFLRSLPGSQQENHSTVSTVADQSSRPRRSLPVIPTLPRKHQARAIDRNSAYDPGYTPSIKFDASIAYGHTTSITSNRTSHRAVSPTSDNAHSFYNSAVSAQLNPLRVVQRPTMQNQYQVSISPQTSQDTGFHDRPDSIYSVSSSSHGSFHDSVIANNNISSYFSSESC